MYVDEEWGKVSAPYSDRQGLTAYNLQIQSAVTAWAQQNILATTIQRIIYNNMSYRYSFYFHCKMHNTTELCKLMWWYAKCTNFPWHFLCDKSSRTGMISAYYLNLFIWHLEPTYSKKNWIVIVASLVECTVHRQLNCTLCELPQFRHL